MKIGIADAKPKLSELVNKAYEGEEVILTSRGIPKARIVAIGAALQSSQRLHTIRRILADIEPNKNLGPAEHADKFLYDEDGMPK